MNRLYMWLFFTHIHVVFSHSDEEAEGVASDAGLPDARHRIECEEVCHGVNDGDLQGHCAGLQAQDSHRERKNSESMAIRDDRYSSVRIKIDSLFQAYGMHGSLSNIIF